MTYGNDDAMKSKLQFYSDFIKKPNFIAFPFISNTLIKDVNLKVSSQYSFKAFSDVKVNLKRLFSIFS
jgi:hypothetical protein